MIKLSDYVFNVLEKNNVGHVFMLSGGGCMHLVDSVGSAKHIKYVCFHHEQAATIAAVAYGQSTNNLGVALVTTGPGSTNAITGVAGAWAESIPLLVLSGQVKRADISGSRGVRMLGFQEVDSVSCVKHLTKYAITIMDPLDIRYHLEKAIYHATTGRKGPVWIDIPLDVQASMIDETSLRSFYDTDEFLQFERSSPKVEIDQIEQLFALLKNAKRPVIITGNGVKVSGANIEFDKLIRNLNIPVLTTWKAIDLLAQDDPLFCGRPGCVGQRGANFIQQNSDLIISVGARLDFGQIGYEHNTFARDAKKVIVDIDNAELNKFNFKIDIAIHGDVLDFCKKVNKVFKTGMIPEYKEWWVRCKDWKTKYPIVLDQYKVPNSRVSTYYLVELLSKEAKSDDVFVPGSSGACSDIFMQAFSLQYGQKVFNCPGLGSMGYGLPSTIGVAFALKKKVININGDGGFQLNIQELDTVVRYKLPVVYFILSNDAYGSIKTTQRNYFNHRYVGSDPSSGVTIPDMIKIAEAYGLKTIAISKNDEVVDGIRMALSAQGPILVDVKVDIAEAVQPKLSSKVKDDGTIVSMPLEDLWPFLPRDEFENNMIIPAIKE
jgi:acetolactate synthase-1/2/3 large subunit